MIKGEVLSEYLELWGFQGSAYIYEDASLGFALKLSPLDVSCFSNDERNTVSVDLMRFLNKIPSGVDLQFVCDVKAGGSASVLDAHTVLGADSKNEFASQLSQKRVENLEELDINGELPSYETYLFVRRPMKEALVDNKKIFHSEKKYQKIADGKLKKEIDNLNRLKELIQSALLQAGVETSSMHGSEVVKLVFDQWNPGRSVDLGEDGVDTDDVRDSILFSDVSIADSNFLIGETHHKVISLKRYPELTSACLGEVLTGLPFGTRLYVTIHVPEQDSEISALQGQRRLAFAMARGKKEGVADLDSEAKLNDLEDLLEQMISSNEKVFRVSVNAVVRDKDREKLDEKCHAVLSSFPLMNGAEAMLESVASFQVFREMALPNARASERARRIKTSNLSDFLPVYGFWQGMTSDPSVLLRQRNGGLLSFNPFSADLSNANMLVSGASGAGKSYLVNFLVLQMLKENPKVYFVDIGGSYKKLCENLGGQYLDLSIEDNLSINPFDLLHGERTPSSSKIKFLVSLVELMTKEEGAAQLPKLERAILEENIQKVYEECEKPRLSDLKKLLETSEEESIRKYGKILSTWCGDSAYGKFLDRETNISLEKEIIAFDLKNLESHPDLQAVVLFLITDLVWREIQSERSKKKIQIYDECWKLLKNESAISYIEEAFRTFRKYNASAVAISQDIDDFAKSKISTAIMPNCATKWLLMQPQCDAKNLKNLLNLNDMEVEIVKSLSQEKGNYSESFLIAGKNKTVAVIQSLALDYWISTTDPRDLAEIEAFTENNEPMTKLEVLEELSEAYPHGVAAGLRKKEENS